MTRESDMHVDKNDITTKLKAPGATARHQPGFGEASGELAAEYFSMAAGTDLAPLLEGLTGDHCPSPHWGYVIEGDLVVSYSDGTEECCTGGEVFYWPGGHSVRVERDAEIVLFSPPHLHGPVIDHIGKKVANVW
jgi:hypothetical protein